MVRAQRQFGVAARVFGRQNPGGSHTAVRRTRRSGTEIRVRAADAASDRLWQADEGGAYPASEGVCRAVRSPLPTPKARVITMGTVAKRMKRSIMLDQLST